MGKAVGAGLALLFLLVGVPALFWLLTGPPPIPTGFPTRSDLTQPIGIDAVLVVFRAVVWLAWLQFVVCTIAEVASLVRGGGLPRPVPLSGWTQSLARTLVGSVLVGGVLLSGGTAQAAVSVPEPNPARTSVLSDAAAATGSAATPDDQADTTVGSTPGQRVGGSMVGAPASPGGAEEIRAEAGSQGHTPRVHVPGVPAEMTDVIGRKVVIVQAPEGHYHDNLWDIAEKSLGDGRRWKEIYDLNQDRVQPDGQQLVLGRLIQPGWVLIMPEDAVGAPRVSDNGQGVNEKLPAEVGDSMAVGLDSVADDGTQAHRGDLEVRDVTHSQSTASQLARGGMLSAALFVGLVVERRRRRGRLASTEELEAEVELRIGADTERVGRLDAALRNLSAACELEQVAVPQAHAVTVSDTSLSLHLAPPAPKAPSPWIVHEDGARWELTADAELHGGSGPAPYPGLVCLGRDDQRNDVLLDLEALGGLLSLTGSAVVAREVVSAWAVQLAVAPWADEQVVRGYHLEPTLGEIGGARVEPVEDLDALVTEWSVAEPRHASADVLSGQSRRTPDEPGKYVVLGATPEPDDVERLARLVSTPHTGVGVVAAVPVPGARWQLQVDDSGRLQVPLLDIEVEAVRLTAAAAEQVAGLFAKSRQSSPIHDGDRVAVPQPPRSGRDDHYSLAPVRVGILGRLDLRASNAMDPARLALASEIVTFLAVQSTPVHRSVLGASIWPGGVSADVRDATIDRVRDWLGQGADGSYQLRETDEGRLHLSDDVAVDWHAFCTLAREARGRGPEDERELLRRALQLVRGELLLDRPAQRYSWLARTRLERQVADVVTDAAHRLCELSLPADPGGAEAASRSGLRMSPTSQVLWRDLLRSVAVGADSSSVEEVVVELRGLLRECGAPVEPETDALLEELLPGRHEGAGGA